MKKVYIAHPLEGRGSKKWGNRKRNIDRYLHFCAAAMKAGYAVISWVHQELTHQKGYTDGGALWYLAMDKELLLLADELWACCPEGASSGVDLEVAWAKEAGIEVVRKPEWANHLWYPGLEGLEE